MSKQRPEPLLWLSDSRGIYIPRDFATSFADRDKNVIGVSAEDWASLDAGPDGGDHYWDTWDEVLTCAIVDDDGVKFTLYQDGDLWLIPEGMEWDDQADGFKWPEENDE